MAIKPITLITRSLEYGGAERQLVDLAKGLRNVGLTVTVLTFYSHGKLENDLIAAGVPLHSLNKKGRWDIIQFILRFCRYIRKSDTKILYAFLGTSCIMGFLAGLIRPDMHVIWGVRASNMDLARYDWLVRLSYRFECLLSRFADLIIANSKAGKEYALSNGFPEDKTIVIPNGIDINYFRHDQALRRKVRAEWLISDEDVLIGIVARLDPMKDHPVFIEAASKVAKQRKNVMFVCIGDGPLEYKNYLVGLAIDNGLEGRLIWAGARQDMPSVYSALDIATLSSYGEGFPNVIGEAMACEVPCVVTDVGDASWIVGETGVVVKPRDTNALAAGMMEMLDNIKRKWDVRTSEARKRVCEHFDTQNMVAQTVKALKVHDD